MLFNSGLFLFGFFPAFLLLYFSLPSGWRNHVLLGASLLFYAWTEPVFIFWALGSAILDYNLGQAIFTRGSNQQRKILVGIGVVANLGLLAWFKYATFAAHTISSLFEMFGAHGFSFEDVALPVAISFITFEKITYLVDLYRGTGRPAPNLGTYLLYVFFFPKLLAGPIIRYCDIQEQLVRRSVEFEDFRAGLVRFAVGLGKKVLIADYLGNYADQVFGLDPHQLGCGDAWLGLIAFTLQIYFDFSGYSDVAIGIARLLGFHLPENFNHPYLATSITEFWRRWHISLTTWIKNYVYIPLGGNRASTPRIYLNLLLCFLLSGLWHGAAWTFVLWGAYHGILLIIDRVVWLRWQQRWPATVNRVITLLAVMIGWVVFRARDRAAMGAMFGALVSPGRAAQPNVLWFSPDLIVIMLAGGLLVLLPLLRQPENRRPAWLPLAATAGSIALVALVICRLAVSSFNAFLYFRF